MIRVAMAGAGYFAGYHLDAWRRIDDVEVCAIADLDLARARGFGEADGIDAYDDVDRMLAEARPDVLDIITPPRTHHQLATAAASRGIHVICQKPLAPTLDEAVQLVEDLARYDVRFMVHENFRWQPWYRTIRRLIDDGTAGTPFSALFILRTGDGWQSDAYLARQPYFRDYPRLLLYETGVHFVDTFRYLFGSIDSVYARTRRRNPAIAGEDAGVVVLDFASDVTATLDASRYNEPDHTVAETRYTFGTFRVDTERGHLTLSTDGTVTWQALGASPVTVLADPPTAGFAGDSVRALQEHFVAGLRSGEPFESEGRDYLLTIRAVEACYRSASRHQAVSVADM